MKEIIRTYNTQFEFVPVIVNEHMIRKHFKQVILCGMGGSHLPAGILKTIEPGIDIYVHRDYDLPPFSKAFLESSLLIASSFSGNTEEAISFYKKAKQLYDLPVLCISTGGELIRLAQENNDPHIVLPQTQFVPRTALGLSTIALASVFKEHSAASRIQNLRLDMSKLEHDALEIVARFDDKTPVFYASNANLHLAYNWKIKFNETAKRAAFYNVFPEANHNELEGYEYSTSESPLIPVLLRDSNDHPRIQKRFDVFEQILTDKGVSYVKIDISDSDSVRKIFGSIVTGDFVTALLAEKSGVPQAEVPLIESFKKRLV